MYFLSELDPDHKIKGSRDPLGFQTIWSGMGRKIIPNLSTVSSNLNDFRILCLAMYYWKSRNYKEGFIPFFLRLEQAFAYVRWSRGDKSFNGTDKVGHIMTSGENLMLHLSATQHQILSDQRVYGIYGKYISPSRSMRLFEVSDFIPAMEEALVESGILKEVENFCCSLEKEDREVCLNDLSFLEVFYQNLPEMEREFYQQHILVHEEPAHPQNVLFHLLKAHPEIVEETNREFRLHPLIGQLKAAPECTEKLAGLLEQISRMDQVLYTLNAIFKLILAKPRQRLQKVLEEPVWEHFPDLDFSFGPGTEIDKLSNLCKQTSEEIVKGLIRRNAEISRRKRGAPWVELDGEEICVANDEYGKRIEEFKPMENYEFTYFLSNYIGLFKQIMYGKEDIATTA